MRRPGPILAVLLVFFVVFLLAVVYANAIAEAVRGPFAARPGPDGTVEIVLTDFRFSPSVIRVKAGQRVRLHLRNEGKHTHEFMMGRAVHVEEGVTEPPEPDFFEGIADVRVEVKGSAMPMGFPGMEGMQMGEMGGMQMGEMEGMQMGEMGGMQMGPVAPGAHAEGMVMEEEHHGSMVMLDPGAEATIEFTVPPDKVGTWVFGCFQEEGLHYDDGMRGILVVEP